MTIPKLQLVSHDLCPYVQRAIITLLEKDIPHERIYIDLSHKPEWFNRISPLGKVPLLKIDNEVLFESAVICEYLDEITPGSLHPVDALEKAKHRSLIEFGSSILNLIAGFYNAPDKDSFKQKHSDIVAKFVWIESRMYNEPYFAGKSFSLVDAVYGPIFRYFDVFETIVEYSFFSDTPHVRAWRQALQSRSSIQNAVVEDYSQRLLAFLLRRNKYISTLIQSN